MKLLQKIVTVSVAAVVGVGAGAAGASAYSIAGGSYTGTATADHSFEVGGGYTITCPAALTTFTGSATGADSTDFTPYYGGAGDCDLFGLPATVSVSGDRNIKITSGPDASGWYVGDLHIPVWSTTIYSVPLAGCTVTVSGTQQFGHGLGGNTVRARNVSPSGVVVEYDVSGVVYTAHGGCPFSSGSSGRLRTNGVVGIPGVTIS